MPRRELLLTLLAAAALIVLPAPARASAAPLTTGSGPLAGNGFTSPLCDDPASVARLDLRARANCSVSGIAAAPAPISNYQFDVHIDTGVLGVNTDTIIQDLLLTPLWTALVWLVHALLVALEWSYSLNLLGGGALRAVGDALRSAQATFTQPWLVLVLAIAAVLLVFEGVVRRRVSETIGHAATTTLMVVAGLSLIANPAGTVGALSRTVNDASLGTVAAISSGTPDRAEGTFATALGGVFETAVTGPWCYLEFGDVGWCLDPARVDPRLRAGAARIAADDRRGQPGGRPPAVLRGEATLLTQARSNGQYFLALPANGPLRNSVNDSGSLLRVICGASDLASCTGPSAVEAEFRGSAGTWSRAGGLVFVAIGTIGMLALLGFVAVRLLAAALMSVLYLLLAPVAVLAPALGEGGRAAFRAWSARLLGAVVAKLVYSVLLGVIFLMVRVLLSLGALGWWTQWLLVASFWWIAFAHRERLLAHVFRDQPGRAPAPRGGATTRQLLQIVRSPTRHVLAAAGAIAERGREVSQRPPRLPPAARPDPLRRRDAAARDLEQRDLEQRDVADPPPVVATRQMGGATGPSEARDLDRAAVALALGDQARRTLAIERDEAGARVAAAAGGDAQARDARRRRIAAELDSASARGDPRRAVSLRLRLDRLDTDARALAADRELAAAGTGAQMQALERRRAGELDRAAAAAGPAVGRAQVAAGLERRREQLTAIAGVGRDEYERMAPAERRRVRLDVARELERRRDWLAAASRAGEAASVERTPPPADEPGWRPGVAPVARSPRERQFTRRQFEDLVG